MTIQIYIDKADLKTLAELSSTRILPIEDAIMHRVFYTFNANNHQSEPNSLVQIGISYNDYLRLEDFLIPC